MTRAAAAARVGPPPARVVFFGAGAFGRAILTGLLELPIVRVVGVVSAPDRPVGRHGDLTPPPVAALARQAGLPLLQPERLRDPATVTAISALSPVLGVLADYGRIVPPAILDLPPAGILNVHPSLLPRHRGATPIAGTILAGDDRAGVTIMRMDVGLDTGPLVASVSWALDGTETAPELEAEAARRGAALLVDTVPAWLQGEGTASPQDEAAATLTRPFRREDGRLDPARPAIELERRVRALQPWPGTFLETTVGRLAVLEASVEPGAGPAPAEWGTLVADEDGLALVTRAGRLRLRRVRPAGGRAMSAADYRRGAGRALVGTRVLVPRID